MSGKPYKIWSADRSLRKGVIASSLDDLIQKGCEKLNMTMRAGIKVVLEADGTQVDEEEYFDFLEEQTTFLLLSEGETWKPAEVKDLLDGGEDFTDFSSQNEGSRLGELARRLCENMTNIVAFSPEDMQFLVDQDVKVLSKFLHKTEGDTRQLQRLCQNYLSDKQDAQESLQLLQLIRQAQQIQLKGRQDS